MTTCKAGDGNQPDQDDSTRQRGGLDYQENPSQVLLSDLVSEMRACNIPSQFWEYFTIQPEEWSMDAASRNKAGLRLGVEAVVSAPMINEPVG